MLRCGEGATTEVLVILIEPLPPRTHPKVTVVAGAMTTEFIGSVVAPGDWISPRTIGRSNIDVGVEHDHCP
jgi:hypothetical protein